MIAAVVIGHALIVDQKRLGKRTCRQYQRGSQEHDVSAHLHPSSARSSHLEKLDPVRLPEIARVLLFRRIVPMLKYSEAALYDPEWDGVRCCEVGPFRSQKIEAHRIDRYSVKRHEDAARPGVVERRHLPLVTRRRIRILVSIEPVDEKHHGFLAEILMPQANPVDVPLIIGFFLALCGGNHKFEALVRPVKKPPDRPQT